MGVLTSQKISNYYDRFKDIHVTLTKDIIQATGLLTQQVHLKSGNDFWPCVVYSSSFENAKIVANVGSGLLEKLKAANNFVSIRYSFKPAGEVNPVTFFVAGRITATAPYGNSEDVNLLTLQYTNRPPDDFIEIMGRVLDAHVNSTKRHDVRVLLNADTMRKLNILSCETVVHIERVPRRCILRDLSFSGAKVIMMGVAKFLVDKEVMLRVEFNDPREFFSIKGSFVRAEKVEGKAELVALAVNYDLQSVPMNYKIRLNDFLTATRADMRGAKEDDTPSK